MMMQSVEKWGRSNRVPVANPIRAGRTPDDVYAIEPATDKMEKMAA
jgi:hypothetical protein